jgi:hypothetical protein
MIEVSMHVQLHIKWTLWIHKRMIMMSFNINSHLNPCHSPKTVWELPSHLCCYFQIQADFGEFGMIEVSMHVQLHIKWTLWIHKTMTMMSFNINSHLDPCHSPKTVWQLPSHLCCHFQIQADFGEFRMIKVSMHVQLHIKWTLWIHKKMIMMSFSKKKSSEIMLVSKMSFNKNSHLDPC